MLEMHQLEKRYDNGGGTGPLTLTVENGEICAIVGPNGAGKSTLFNIIAGVIGGYRGAWKLNAVPADRLYRRELGYLPEQSFCFSNFTPREFCSFDASMRGLGLSPEDVEAHLNSFDCGTFIDTRIGKLSQGMAKRVSLACAFAGTPSLVLLDEPLNAIDIKTTILLKERVRQLRESGCVVLISSHVLDFVDEVADRVVFLKNGHVELQFDPKEQSAEEMYRKSFIDSLQKQTERNLSD